MSVRRSFLNWGVFLICLGLVPLAVQFGVLDPDVASALVRLWPLILIGIGLGLLLRITPYAVVGGLVVAVTAGLLLGSLLSGGIAGSGAIACTGDAANGPTVTRNGTFSAGSSSVSAEITCADFELSRVPGQGWTADVVTSGTEPTINGSDSTLTLRSRSAVEPLAVGREAWRVTVPSEGDFSGSFTFNAGKSNLRLGGGAVAGLSATYNAVDALLDMTGATGTPSLSATLNATSLDLILPQAPMTGSMTLNAASLDMCTAPGVGVRIDWETTLGSNNFSAAGLVESGGAWQSPDYASAATRIDMDVTANVSSMNLNPAGGCQ